MGEKIARAGGWECSWNCNVGERERGAETHLGEQERRPSAAAQAGAVCHGPSPRKTQR